MSINLLLFELKIKYNNSMNEDKKEKIELIKKSFELKSLKRYKEAIELLYKALEYDDYSADNVELLSQIGDLYIQLGNYDRALEEFNRALNLNRNHAYSIQKCYDIYIMTKQYKKALRTAQMMTEQSKTPQNYYNYMNALMEAGETQDALAVFNSLDEDIKLDTGVLYLASKLTPEKKQLILEKIVELDYQHQKANLDLASIAYSNGEWEKLIQYCINIDEDCALAQYYLAMVEAHRKNYTKAIELLTRAIILDKDEHDFYFDLAKIYIDICWLDEALLSIKKSINLSLIKNNKKDIDEKYYFAGWILVKLGKFSSALMNLETIEKDSKYYTKAQVLIQVINLKNDNVALAKVKLEELYKKESDNPILLDSLAMIYKELKLYKQALEIYEKAANYFPDSIYYTLEIIDLLIDLKDYDRALSTINDFIEICKNCPSVYNSLARVYYRLKKYDEALASINKYLDLDKNSAEACYFRGLILNDLEKYSDAISSIYDAIKFNPKIAKYYAQMARSYTGIKEYDNALLYIKEAIEIDPAEIGFKKQAFEIAKLIGNDRQIAIFENQLKRSENIIKLKR